ncbi:DUF2058 domain-containing protein [Acinetobacter puyangensis]|uniref:DUF2058 domain-containing protein n=1 Tax=Acinetobacter puyangensis TaxID=1096779 RepID=UPI003A4D7F0F
MVKNALQAQLLKAGLIDNKQAKKSSKQVQHAKKTGQDTQAALKAEIEKAKQEKIAKDNELNHAKQQILEEKTLKANIIQMIKQHQITATDGDITYQFIDENKIKKLYVNQQVYNAVVSGSLAIAKLEQSYAFIPQALAEKIDTRMQGYIISIQKQAEDQSTDEEDPYAAYVIPDDLMW